ncbi:purple acid phosphatase family protein [Humisphaera borealis]|uniref:Metallophosphoesterase family protein n=1 Tax=Humisphaera borealis TaxID=2807512 RepID=A0A7M2X040_9BACT|nr:metallophosphoesterase family protein [Humisphaera borealis]QOV91004.1 metallophosphoesterase family protein [Humisphaera borealis]
MSYPSRRAFLASSLAALAGARALGADADSKAGPATKPSTLPSTQPTAPLAVEDAAFQPSTLFLTWQRDPTTTMTVQWIGVTGETADTRVYCSTAVGVSERLGLWPMTATPKIKPYPMTDFKVFRAELTGLQPDTTYYFRIGKSSPIYNFRTMPARATNTISFISGGDCGVNSHAIANNIQAARQDPMFAVVGGDLGYDNGKSVDISLAFIRNYSKHMIAPGGRLIPMIPCIGNHEVDGGYGKKREKAPFYYALFDGLFPDTGYNTLDFGDYLSLVLLDTGHTSEIGGEQASWLENQLKARVDHPNVFAVNHVPAYPSYRKMGTTAEKGAPAKAGTGSGNRQHWCPLFDKYRVPVVLEHHDHTFKRTKPLIDGMANDNGVLYLGDGSWGRLRNPNTPDKLTHLAVTSRDYHLSLHRIQGQERFHIALDENGRVMDVGHSGQRTKGLVQVKE